MKKILKKILKDPKIIFLFIINSKLLHFLSDELFLRIKYRVKIGEKLNLKNPKNYNEKLQWLKINDRNPIYSKMVDKFEVRNYIEEKIGDKYLIPLYGVYDSVDDINFDKLPNKFVLKCTHDSGGLIICKDKSKLNIKESQKKLKKKFNNDFYYKCREWPYKSLKPRIICETLLVQENNEELRDYRFFCFDGEPKFISIDFNITEKNKTRRNLYDLNWNLKDEEISYPKKTDIKIEKPENLDEMIKLSKVLSKNIPHARIDFYNINGKIYFGEITFYHQSGLGEIQSNEFNNLMGDWIKIS